MKLRRLTPATPATRQLLLISLCSSYAFGAATSFVTLSQFQQINGFSAACTNAYNTPIPGCTDADFATPSSACSLQCVAGLQAISTALNTACKGTLTDPTTLIGLFFEGKGVNALCPNIQSSSTTSSTTSTQTTKTQPPPQQSTTTTTTTSTSKSTPPPQQTSSSSTLQQSTTSSTSEATTSLSSSSTPATTTSSTSQSTIASSQSVASSSRAGTFTGTASAASSSSSTTSESPNTTSGPAVFGGGAIPFTVNNSVSGSAPSACLNGMAFIFPIVSSLWALRAVL